MKQLSIVYLLISTTMSIAQEFSLEHPTAYPVDFGFEFGFGIKFSDLTDLNRILTAEGLPKSPTSSPLVGSGMNLIFGNHMVHFNGNAVFNETGNDLNGTRNLTRGWGGGINYGYRIGLNIFNFVPTIGITRDALIVELEQLPSQTNNIQDQLSNRNISKLKSEVFAASIGFRVLFHSDNGTMFPGLNFSYQIPLDTQWLAGDFETTGAPSLNISQFKIGIEVLFLTGRNDW